MYTGLYASRRAPCLEEQCLAQLTHYETRTSLRNVEQLSKMLSSSNWVILRFES
jgi:hypothetical protein